MFEFWVDLFGNLIIHVFKVNNPSDDDYFTYTTNPVLFCTFGTGTIEFYTQDDDGLIFMSTFSTLNYTFEAETLVTTTAEDSIISIEADIKNMPSNWEYKNKSYSDMTQLEQVRIKCINKTVIIRSNDYRKNERIMEYANTILLESGKFFVLTKEPNKLYMGRSKLFISLDDEFSFTQIAMGTDAGLVLTNNRVCFSIIDDKIRTFVKPFVGVCPFHREAALGLDIDNEIILVNFWTNKDISLGKI